MEGLMSLPQGATDQGMGIDPELISPVVSSYAKNDPRSFNRDMLSALNEADPALIQQIQAELADAQLSREEIDAFRLAIDRILANPEDYETIRKELLEQDFPEELLPPTFDGAFFQALSLVAETLQPAAQEPMAMAQGGLATLNPIAREMAAMGRNGDTMLAHITPQEAALLKSRGGSGTINPYTGLPEFFIGKIFKGIGKAVKGVVKGIKKVLESPVGRLVATVALGFALGPASASFFGSNLGAAGFLGVTSPTIAFGVNSALASTLVGVASGQKLGDALKGGVIAGVTAGVGSKIFNTLPAGYEAGAAAAAPTADVTVGTPTVELPGVEAATAGTPDVSNIVQQAGPGEVTAFEPAVTSPVDLGGGSITQYENYFPPDGATGTVGGGPGYADIRPFSPNGPSYQPSVMADRSVLEATNMPGATGTVPTTPGAPTTDLGGGMSATERLAQQGSITSTGELATMPGVTAPVTSPVQQLGGYDVLGGPSTGAGLSVTQAPPVPGVGENTSFWETVKEGPGKIWDTYLSPNRGMPSETTIASRAQEIFKEYGGKLSMPAARDAAIKELTPGMISRYAPLAAVGTVGLAGAGFFDTPEEPEPSDLFADYPDYSDWVSKPLIYGGTRTSGTYRPSYSAYSPTYSAARGYADGGIASLAKGGDPSNYPRKNGHINGPGTGTSDDVPAMLSDGEFVFTAKAVRAMGNGSRRKGAKKMYALMKALEKRSA